MSVVYLTGFNGTSFTHSMQLSNLTTVASASYQTMVLGNLENGINRIFGYLDSRDVPSPALSMIHMRGANGTWGGQYCTLTVGPSSTDPTVASMAINGNLSTAADWWIGWGMSFSALGFTESTSFRLGFRLYRSDAFNENPIYFSDVTTTARSHYRLTYTPKKGSEQYVEIEWLASSKTLNLYVDDELIMTSGSGFSSYQPWASLSAYTQMKASGTTTLTTAMEFKDLYLQVIESDKDVRLGSATRVWAFTPSADDDVQYIRPAGYDSNYAVAAGTMYADTVPAPSTPTAYLSATEVGQHDSYRTNATAIASKLATVEAVQIRGYGSNPLSGTRLLSARAELDGNVLESSPTSVPQNTGFRQARLIMPSDPSGSRWTPAAVAALKIGTKVQG